jgi:pantetheine-phosphate adenylyltransferase
MDVLVLIDKLDDLVHQAKAVPLTDQVRIDREEIYDILDQMRATIPEEIKQARWIVKGLRVISDFEWEFQMNQLNRTLAPDIETVYVMASPSVSFVSSSGVKEIAAFGGAVDELVPAAVARRFRELHPGGRPGTPENPTD